MDKASESSKEILARADISIKLGLRSAKREIELVKYENDKWMAEKMIGLMDD